jgi:short-subunit dehydrogenase
MSFKGKTAWITGASSGIGEALTAALLEEGAFVILSGRRVEELKRVAQRHGNATLIHPFEASDFAVLGDMANKALDWRGGIDLLVNNAGISQRSLAVDTSFDVYRRIVDIDLLSPIALTQAVLPSMVARKSGHIAAVSSVAGKVGAPLRTAYCAAKHGVIGYFDALRAEVETAYNIRVSTIIPGSVKTAVAANALNADGTTRGVSDVNIDNGIPADVAGQTILAGLNNGDREIIVAEGVEAGALELRRADPATLFAFTAAEGARLAAAREAGKGIDPTKVNT